VSKVQGLRKNGPVANWDRLKKKAHNFGQNGLLTVSSRHVSRF
jgi:hypothetical protein